MHTNWTWTASVCSFFSSFSIVHPADSSWFGLTQSQVNDRLTHNSQTVKFVLSESFIRVAELKSRMCNSHIFSMGLLFEHAIIDISTLCNPVENSLVSVHQSSVTFIVCKSANITNDSDIQCSTATAVTNDWMQSAWWFYVWQETFPLLESNSICSRAPKPIIFRPTPKDYLSSWENDFFGPIIMPFGTR